jgi:hypothetical protein
MVMYRSPAHLGRNRRHIRYWFKCLCTLVGLLFRFDFLSRSLAFDLNLFGLSLFGHVIASP